MVFNTEMPTVDDIPAPGSYTRPSTNPAQNYSWILGNSSVYGSYAGKCVQVTPDGGDALKKQFPSAFAMSGKANKKCATIGWKANAWGHQIPNPNGVNNGAWFAKGLP